MKGFMTGAVAAVALAGTALAQDVTVDYDRAANFAAIKTFSVKLETQWGNPIGEKRLVDEMTQALVEKGWKVAPEADAQVLIHGASRTKRSLNTFYSGMGGWGWRGWGGGMGSATTTANEYTEGTLVVDIYEAKSKQLMWRGVAQGELKDKPEKREKQLQKVTDKFFKDFPPGSAKK